MPTKAELADELERERDRAERTARRLEVARAELRAALLREADRDAGTNGQRPAR